MESKMEIAFLQMHKSKKLKPHVLGTAGPIGNRPSQPANRSESFL